MSDAYLQAGNSFAAQAVAAGPPTLAPPSFEGQGWLYVLNLFVFTAGFALCWMLTGKLLIDTFLCWIAPEDLAEGEAWHSPAPLQRRFPNLPSIFVRALSLALRVAAPTAAPDHDDWSAPIMLHRRIGVLWSFAFGLRCGSEAQSLWRWNPYDPVGAGAAHVLKRILDPIAADIGYLALALYFLSLPGITEQLRKEPFPISMWTSLPLLKRPGGVVLCCLGAAVAVVAFR